MKAQFLSELAAALGDLITEHPEAAAVVVRRISRMLAAEAEREAERERENLADMRRRGF